MGEAQQERAIIYDAEYIHNNQALGGKLRGELPLPSPLPPAKATMLRSILGTLAMTPY
jgi:hypothetical protein